MVDGNGVGATLTENNSVVTENNSSRAEGNADVVMEDDGNFTAITDVGKEHGAVEAGISMGALLPGRRRVLLLL